MPSERRARKWIPNIASSNRTDVCIRDISTETYQVIFGEGHGSHVDRHAHSRRTDRKDRLHQSHMVEVNCASESWAVPSKLLRLAFRSREFPLQHAVPSRGAERRAGRRSARQEPRYGCLERDIVICVHQAPLVIDEPVIARRIPVNIAIGPCGKPA